MVGCVGHISRVCEELKKRDGRDRKFRSQSKQSFHYCCCGYWRSGYQYFFPDTKPIVDGVKPLAEKGLQEAFRKDKLTEGQKFLISGLRFISLFFIVVAAVIGLCLIWSFNGWSFWKVTGYFLLHVFFCFAPTFLNMLIFEILDDR
ncbi:hypothetical protein HMPREF1394_00242 [Helicobacter pylori GAM105Ai]|nr:hypothetical protein HMPREF1394_00242 [Helicobacter pylori GAM105Ai]